MELPRIEKLWNDLKEQDVSFIAVEARQDTERALSLIQEHSLSFTLLENGEEDNDIVKTLFNVRAFPTTFIIDKKGKVIYFHLGFEEGDEEKYLEEIQKLL